MKPVKVRLHLRRRKHVTLDDFVKKTKADYPLSDDLARHKKEYEEKRHEERRLADFVAKAKAEDRAIKATVVGALMGPEDLENLQKKLYPGRFPGMSPKMAAILGYVLDKKWTDPAIDDMVVTSDGGVLAQHSDDVGMNTYIGTRQDLERNWEGLLDAADLTVEERSAAERLFTVKILDYRNVEPGDGQ